nr:zinc finger, RING/FYVE/PHD-type [Tanacetum cinerariifolium]
MWHEESSNGSTIQRVPVYILKAVPTDCSDCPICLEEFRVGQEVHGLPCAHNFHVACIDTWLKLNVKCPRCRCFVFSDANSNKLSAYPVNPGRLSISTSRDLRVQPPLSPYLMKMQSFLLPVHTDNQQPRNSSSSSSSSSGFGSTTINSPGTRLMLVEQGGGASDDNDDPPASVEPVTPAQALALTQQLPREIIMKNLLENWLAKDKLECSEELGDLVKIVNASPFSYGFLLYFAYEEELVTGLSRVSWEKVVVSFHNSRSSIAAHSVIQVEPTKITKPFQHDLAKQERLDQRYAEKAKPQPHAFNLWVLMKMDDPNISMEEYIKLKEEKARKCRKVFNWETAKYGKI